MVADSSHPDPIPPTRPVRDEGARPGVPVQPWSDAGRAIRARETHRPRTRRKQLERFNEALADHIIREQREDESFEAIVRFFVQPLLKIGVLTIAVWLYRRQGGRQYTVREWALVISLAISVGLLIDPLWRLIRGPRPDDASRGEDREVERPLTTLGLPREPDGPPQ